MTCIAELDDYSDFFLLLFLLFCNFSFCVGCSRQGLYEGVDLDFRLNVSKWTTEG